MKLDYLQEVRLEDYEFTTDFDSDDTKTTGLIMEYPLE